MSTDTDMETVLTRVALGLELEAKVREHLQDVDDVAELDAGDPDDAQALTWLAETGHDADDLPGMFDDALSIDLNATRTLGHGEEWNLQSIDIHLATGGPGYWIEYDGRLATLVGAWWGDRARLDLHGPVVDHVAQVWDLATGDY